MFDSHCHLTDAAFAADVAEVIARARAAGVRGMVTISSDAADARAALELASRHEAVWCSAGIHPHGASLAGPAERAAVRELARRARVVAVGETGLDYHYDNSPRKLQRELFAWHLELAAELGKPAVVHAREADSDMARMIADAPATAGILHCFSGGEELLRAGLDAGWCISFAGPVTFRRFDGVALVRAVPAERLLIETDSPYLAPVPHRGRRNEPAYLPSTCAAVAHWRGVATDELALMVERNARRCYGLEAG